MIEAPEQIIASLLVEPEFSVFPIVIVGKGFTFMLVFPVKSELIELQFASVNELIE